MTTSTLLGMYIHMHWAYQWPYAARTWTLDDWRGYLEGLARLGYNLVQIWPMIDTLPETWTPSDKEHLEKMRAVIRLARDTYGLRVFMGAAANVIGNAAAGRYTFAERPYFVCEHCLNPAAPEDIARLRAARRAALPYLAEADGFWVLDSDPGGYPGSTPGEFVSLLAEHRALLDEVRPGIELVYWMWLGWRPWEGEAAATAALREIVAGVSALNPEPWGLLACHPWAFSLVREFDLAARTIFLPYGAVEGEPAFPWSNCDPERVRAAVAREPAAAHLRGVLGNSQTHVVQLPHHYFFQHFARGGAPETADLAGFANDLLPGFGGLVAGAWQALAGEDPETLALHAALLAETQPGVPQRGHLGGLLLGGPERFLIDLRLQLRLKLAVLQLRTAVAGGRDVHGGLQEVRAALEGWVGRHGFTDWYFGPFRDLVHPVLRAGAAQLPGGEGLASALDDFAAVDPYADARHHGTLRPILAALSEMAST